MKRRWIIRSFFIGLLLLCVGGWVWSYAFLDNVSHYSGGNSLEVVLCHGGLHLMTGKTTLPDGWFTCHSRLSVYEITSDYSMLGFHLSYHSRSSLTVIPLWSLTTVSAALLWLVWRKTRPKPDPRTAFPVEVKQSHAKEEKTP